MTSDFVVPAPTVPECVVENLPGLLDTASEALRSAACLLVHGHLVGSYLGVKVEGGLEALIALVAHTSPQLAYIDAGTLTADDLVERRADLVDAGLNASELAATSAALDDAQGHLEECAFVVISVVMNGVRHDFEFVAGWCYRTIAHLQPRTAAEEDQEDMKRRQGARLKLKDQLSELTETLVADERFLRSTSYPTRHGRANELAEAVFGEERMVEQHVRGVIAQAVFVATARRAEVVIPKRAAALREKLPQLALALAFDPYFHSASTNQARERCARTLLNKEDPIVPAAPLVHALVIAAVARQARAQAML